MATTQPTTPPQQETLPATVDSLALAVLVVYQGAETDLVVGSGALIAEAIRDPPQEPYLYWRLKALAQKVSDRVRARVNGLASKVASEASKNGNLTALREIRRIRNDHPSVGVVSDLIPHDQNAARLIAEDLANRLDRAAMRITRFADDAYRAATVSSSLAQILGKATPAQAQAQAWRELAAKGVSGFTDARGREWNLASYVEMATRTTVQKAYNGSHRDRLTRAGLAYFTISTSGRPCPLCAPWEGQVLADGGAGIASVDGHTFAVAATVEEATAAGLFHPNCKHTLTAYLPGITLMRKNTWSAADEEQYKATQQLRALERGIRSARLVHSSAVTDLDKALAARQLRTKISAAKTYADTNNLLYRARRTMINLDNKA